MLAKLTKIGVELPAKDFLSSMAQMLSLLSWSRASCSFECSVGAIILSCLHIVLGGRGMSGTSGWQKPDTDFLCHFPPLIAGFAKQLSACMAPSPLYSTHASDLPVLVS